MKFKIENEIVKAKNALTANKLVVDGIEYDICGVREEKLGVLTFFTMIFKFKGDTEFKQFDFAHEDEIEVRNLNIK